MHAPKIYEFSVFGAPFDCKGRVDFPSDVLIIPFSVYGLCGIFVFLLFWAYFYDKKCRWRRYLILTPATFEIDRKRSPHVYELEISTAWRKKNVDLLIKVCGNTNQSAVIWVQHTLNGILRCGYTDTFVFNVNNGLGTVTRVDLIMVDKTRYTMKEIMRKTKQRQGPVEMDKDGRPKDGGFPGNDRPWGVAEIAVRDPSSLQKFSNKPKGRSIFFFVGSGVAHGVPTTFHMSDCSQIAHPSAVRNAWSAVWRAGAKAIRVVYRHHMISWMLFASPEHITRNLSSFEKTLYFIALSFLMFYVNAVQRNYEIRTHYFISHMGSNHNVLDLLGDVLPLATDYGVLSLTITLITDIFLHSTARFVCGTYQRTAECQYSYWQGRELLLTAFFFLKWAVECVGAYFVKKPIPDPKAGGGGGVLTRGKGMFSFLKRKGKTDQDQRSVLSAELKEITGDAGGGPRPAQHVAMTIDSTDDEESGPSNTSFAAQFIRELRDHPRNFVPNTRTSSSIFTPQDAGSNNASSSRTSSAGTQQSSDRFWIEDEVASYKSKKSEGSGGAQHLVVKQRNFPVPSSGAIDRTSSSSSEMMTSLSSSSYASADSSVPLLPLLLNPLASAKAKKGADEQVSLEFSDSGRSAFSEPDAVHRDRMRRAAAAEKLRKDKEEAETRRFIMSIITHRNLAPGRIGGFAKKKKKLPNEWEMHDSGYYSQHGNLDHLEVVPEIQWAIFIRFVYAFACVLFWIVAATHMVVRGKQVTDGAGQALALSLVKQYAGFVFITSPLAGWIAFLVSESFVRIRKMKKGLYKYGL